MRFSFATVLITIVLAACDAVPDLAAGRPDPGPAPSILPLDDLLATVEQGAPADPGDVLAARAAALRARAAGLRGPVTAP